MNQSAANPNYSAGLNNQSALAAQQYSAAGLNDAARTYMATVARKPSSLPLRQRGDAERLRKPVKIRK